MLGIYQSWLLMTAALAGSLSLSAQEAHPRPASDFLDPRGGVTEEELVTRARLRQNPSLTLGGLKEVNGGDNAINVKGSLPLELFGRRARRTEVAENKEEATQQGVADHERLLTGEVRMRFGQALAAIRDLTFVDQLLQVNRDFLRLMEDRAREGAVPALDADEIRVEANRVETLRIDYQAKAEVALLALKETVGVDPEEPIRLKGALELAPQDYEQKQLLQLAMDHRPDRPSSGRTKNLPMQNFVPIGRKENQTPVSSAVTSGRTSAFLNEPSMQREILHRYAKLSTTLFSAS